MNTIKDNAVRSVLADNGRELIAKLPDGTKIPFITEINVHSEVRSLMTATIRLLVHVEDVEKWDEVMQKQVVVQHTIKGEDLVNVINMSKKRGELEA